MGSWRRRTARGGKLSRNPLVLLVRRIGSPWSVSARALLEALERILAPPAHPVLAPAKVLLATVVAWFVYVPLHEMLHAFGCLAAGGSVQELQISPLYGGALLERFIPFVRAGGEYAGRLTQFETGGSDLVYLVTVFAPYTLTLLGAFPLLRGARRHRSAVLFGGGIVLVTAPLISLTGDYYEIGSILVSLLLGAGEGSPWLPLRHDDLFALIGEIEMRFPSDVPGASAAISAAAMVGFLLAGGTLGAARWLADRIRAGGRPAAAAR